MLLYIDVYFFINLVMDYLILFLLWKISRLSSGYMRILLAAILGAGWACIVAVNSNNNLFFWFMSYIGICIIMCRVAFKIKGVRITLICIVGLYLITWMLGGLLNAIYYYTMAGYYVEQFLYGRIILVNSKWLLIISAFASAMIFLIWRLYQSFIAKKRIFYKVILHNKEFIIEVDALLDTGNRLWYNAQAVSLIEWEVARKLLDEDALRILNSYFFGIDYAESENMRDSDTDNIVSKQNYIKKNNIKYNKGGEKEPKDSSNIFWIPYKSVGREEGVLPAVIIDEIIVKRNSNRNSKNKNEKKKHIVIGVINQSFSKRCEYQMIIHPSHI